MGRNHHSPYLYTWPTTKIDPKKGDLRRTSPAHVALLEDLFLWSSQSSTLDSDPYFSVRNGPALYIPTPGAVSEYLKDRGASQGLDPTAISSHCLRHGAATQRTAFGQDKATIH